MAIKCTTLTELHLLKSFRICYALLLCYVKILRKKNSNTARTYLRRRTQLCHGKPLAIMRKIEKKPSNTIFVYKLMVNGSSDNHLDELANKRHCHFRWCYMLDGLQFSSPWNCADLMSIFFLNDKWIYILFI